MKMLLSCARVASTNDDKGTVWGFGFASKKTTQVQSKNGEQFKVPNNRLTATNLGSELWKYQESYAVEIAESLFDGNSPVPEGSVVVTRGQSTSKDTAQGRKFTVSFLSKESDAPLAPSYEVGLTQQAACPWEFGKDYLLTISTTPEA